jgi:hypothetical protein
MTFIEAFNELKQGKTIYNKRYPKICYQYTPHNEMFHKFRKVGFNNADKWYYDEDDAVGFQEILFDDWDILDINGLTFVY